MPLRGSLRRKIEDIRAKRKQRATTTDIAKSVYDLEYKKTLIVERTRAAKATAQSMAKAEAEAEAKRAMARMRGHRGEGIKKVRGIVAGGARFSEAFLGPGEGQPTRTRKRKRQKHHDPVSKLIG